MTNINALAILILLLSMRESALTQSLFVQDTSELELFVNKVRSNDNFYLDLDTLVIRLYIGKLPEEIGRLKKIRYLDVSQCELVELPNVLFNLKTLEYLNVENNRLSELNDNVGDLKKLKYLKIGNRNCHSCIFKNNKITFLPKSITKCKSLLLLSLVGLGLESIPIEIFEIKSLEEANLSANNIYLLPKRLPKRSNIKILRLSGNKLSSISKGLSMLKKLKSLYLDSNYLTVFDDGVSNIKNLEDIVMDKNKIKTVENNINNLKKLKTVSLVENEVANFPANLYLPKLEVLELAVNRLNMFCYTQQHLPSIKRIGLVANRIKKSDVECLKKNFPNAKIVHSPLAE